MNPWRQHPAIAGLPIPESALPPARSWGEAARLGFVRPQANPRDPIERLTVWSGGPVPDPVRGRGRLVGPGNTADTVYRWLVRQASQRLKDVKAFIRSRGRGPTSAELTYKYTVEPGTVESWAAGAKKRAADLGIRVSQLEVTKPKRFSPRTLNIPKNVIYFASGAKNPGEIEGVARVAETQHGIGLGIDVSTCKSNCLRALDVASRRGVSLFVDSGAFREFQSKRTVSDAEWHARFRGYRALASKFGARTHLVAPDKIGDQPETARRIVTFGRLMPKRAMILLAAQGGRPGDLPRHVFWEDMHDLLVSQGVRPNKIVAALPLKAKGFTTREVTKFAEYFGEEVDRYHLLGMGPLGKSFRKTVGEIWKSSPRAKITCDATTIITGTRGNAWELGANPRVYTYAQDIVRYDVMLEAFQRSWRGGHTMEGWVADAGWGPKTIPDYSDAITEIDGWLPERHRKVLAGELEDLYRRGMGPRLTPASRETLLDSVEDWLFTPMHADDPRGPKWYDDQEVEAWLDVQWTCWLGTYFSPRVKRDALGRAWLAKVDHAVNALAFGS